jgi:hypothetical protein
MLGRLRGLYDKLEKVNNGASSLPLPTAKALWDSLGIDNRAVIARVVQRVACADDDWLVRTKALSVLSDWTGMPQGEPSLSAQSPASASTPSVVRLWGHRQDLPDQLVVVETWK